MEGKPQNRMQDISVDEIGRQSKLMPFIVGFHRQEAIPQKGQIRRIVEVLDEIH